MSQDPDARYTYCPDYHHSMAVVPVNVEAVQRAEKEAQHSVWRTANGWTFPGHQTTIQSNMHPKRPDEARIDELLEVRHQ